LDEFLNFEERGTFFESRVEALWGPDVSLCLKENQNLSSLTSDTRTLTTGQVFVALKGKTQTGSSFAQEAADKGARAIVTDSPLSLPKTQVYRVPDPQLAHRKLARQLRMNFRGRVVGIGGAVGKTSTKEFLYALTSPYLKVERTEASQNGNLGIPKTLEKLSSNPDLMIVEIGVDAPGDMARHAEVVNPDFAIVTAIGEEHLNLLQDLEGVFEEERILIDTTLRKGKRAWVPKTDPWLQKIPDHPNLNRTGLDFEGLEAPKLAAHLLQNAALAFQVARSLGLSRNQLQEPLSKLQPASQRGQVWTDQRGRTHILDHYNSNPTSLRAALKALIKSSENPIHLILGDMLDLGEASSKAHEDILTEVQQTPVSSILFVGSQWAALEPTVRSVLGNVQLKFLKTSEDPQFSIQQWLEPHTGQILWKGSRGVALEKLLSKLQSTLS
jgi:UDP-N-acetylmuramoyl-tripeptide--D-alanyl-D-alanine ligase